MKYDSTNIPTAAGPLRRIVLPAAAALLLAACAHDDALPGDTDGRTPVRFEATVLPATPATVPGEDGETRWTEGDRVGVFMIPTGISTETFILTAYTVDPATGVLTPEGTPLFYPQERNVCFMAFYPFPSGLEYGDPIAAPLLCDQTTSEKQAAMDLLFSDNACDISPGRDAVPLRFRHMLAKVRLDLSLGDGLAGGSVTGVELYGMAVDFQYSSYDGCVLSSDTPQADKPVAALRLAAPLDGLDAVYTALVAPQGNYPGRKIVVTVDGEPYAGAIPESDTYAGNAMYVYPVTVQRAGVEVGTPDILPWENTVHDGGTANYVNTLTYDANGGAGSIPDGMIVDGSVTLSAASALRPPAGKVFAGWNTASDASGDFCRPGEVFTSARDTTLYAVWSGDGSSEENPLLIFDAQGMAAIADAPARHYRLIRDLDAESWMPVCSTNNPFTGTFDGQGHTLTIRSFAKAERLGLFGALGAARVRRVCVAGDIEYSNVSTFAAGGIAGMISSGCVIENCLVTANLNVEGSVLVVGGIYGECAPGEGNPTVRNCLVRGNIVNRNGRGMSGATLGIGLGYGAPWIVNCVVLSQQIVSNDILNDRYPVRIGSTENASHNYANGKMSPGDVWKDHAWTSNLTGQDGFDCDPLPAAEWWTADGRWKTDGGFTAWDFTSVWEFGSDGYPRLRVVKP